MGAVGAITDPAFMEQIIADGKVDYVVLARALIADPDLPLKAMNGHTEEIRPCLRCTSCMDGGYVQPSPALLRQPGLWAG